MMADRNIISYVKSSLDRGVPLSKIRSELYKAGWPRKDIEEAIASAGAPGQRLAVQENAPREIEPGKRGVASGQKSRKLLYTGVIIAIILVVGIFSYFTFLSLMLPSNLPIIPSNVTCGDGKCEGGETYEICPADCPAPATNQNVSADVSPATKAFSSGEEVTFEVSISGINNLYGFQFDFEYPSTLSFVKVTEGSFLNKNGAESTFCIPPKSSTGYVTVACTRLGQIGGVSGSGLLASVTFSATGSGTAEPKLKNVKLVDYNLKTIILKS